MMNNDVAVSTKTPHLLFVTVGLGIGGAERHLSLVAPRLKSLGFRVSIYCILEGGPLKSQLEADGIEVLPLTIDASPGSKTGIAKLVPWLIRNVISLWAFLRKEKPEIVHCFLPAAYLIAGPLAILTGVKFLLMSRRGLNKYQSKYPGLHFFEMKLHKRVSVLLGNSKAVIRQLIVDEKAPVENVGLIYNGVDLTQFQDMRDRQSLRAEFEIEEQALVLSIVANLNPYKGHSDLLTALSLVKKHLPDQWVLLVVGRDDGIGDKLQEDVHRLGLDEHIRFLGLRRDIENILSVSDIGLLVSHEEGFSNSLLEGMAFGLPMIATDVGGNSEAVVDGQTGYVVPAHDAQSIGEAIVKLAQNRELRMRFGKAGKLRLVNEFSIDRCVEKYFRLYQTLLEGGSVNDLADIGRVAI